MGGILNNLRTPEVDSLEKLPTNSAEWLTSHADATGLAVVEVERLWHRFQLLTGSNDAGMLMPNSVSDEVANDLFVRNFLQHFPRARSNPNAIPFGYFIVVMQWLETSDIRTKLAGVFLYMNNGQPVGASNIAVLFKLLHPERSESENKAMAAVFMEQLGSDAQGQLNQEQFIKGMQRAVPAHQLDQLLRFEIIPNEVLNDVRDDGSSLPPSTRQTPRSNDYTPRSNNYTPRSNNYTPGNDTISDNQLRQIAERAAQRNWQNLATKMGFLENDIETYQMKNRGDPRATMYDLLLTWRDEDLSSGKKDRLQRYLQQSGFNDLISILDQ